MEEFKMNTWYHAAHPDGLDWTTWSLGCDENKWFTFNNTAPHTSIIKFVYPVADWNKKTDKKSMGNGERVYILCRRGDEDFFVYDDKHDDALKCVPADEATPTHPLIFQPTSNEAGFIAAPTDTEQWNFFEWTNEHYKRPLRGGTTISVNGIVFKEV